MLSRRESYDRFNLVSCDVNMAPSLHPLQYTPYSSDIELAFYSSLANLKINHDKLDSSARKVLGLYEINPKDAPERSSRMQIHGTALTNDEYVSRSA